METTIWGILDAHLSNPVTAVIIITLLVTLIILLIGLIAVIKLTPVHELDQQRDEHPLANDPNGRKYYIVSSAESSLPLGTIIIFRHDEIKEIIHPTEDTMAVVADNGAIYKVLDLTEITVQVSTIIETME